jgi:HSP20 family protein
MTLVKRNGNIIPSFVTDFFDADPFFRPSFLNFSGGAQSGWFPNIPSANIIENGKDYKIELAAPGLTKKDFKIEVDNDVLTISSEKKDEKEEKGDEFRRKEFSYQSFTRSFQLPENSVTDKIDAKYEDGILKLVLPKKTQSPPKQKKEIKVV